MPHDIVPMRTLKGLIRMDEEEENILPEALARRVGGSFRTIHFALRPSADLSAIFPRAVFWICDPLEEPQSNCPHRAVGVLWIVGCEEVRGARAVVYLSGEVVAPNYLPKVLDYMRITYGLQRLP